MDKKQKPMLEIEWKFPLEPIGATSNWRHLSGLLSSWVLARTKGKSPQFPNRWIVLSQIFDGKILGKEWVFPPKPSPARATRKHSAYQLIF